MPSIDPRSAAIAVRFIGTDERGAAGAPARDLSESDIARLAYVRTLNPIISDIGRPIVSDDPESEVYVRPDPRKPDPRAVAEILAELELSGRYELVEPTPKAAKAKPTPDTAATPAEKPEA